MKTLLALLLVKLNWKSVAALLGWFALFGAGFVFGGMVFYPIAYEHGRSDMHWELGGQVPRQPGDEIFKGPRP